MSDSIYKKLTNALFKLSGGQAMPNFSSAQVTSTLTNGETNLVAPFDGYLLLHSVVNTISPTNNELSITDTKSNTRLVTNQGLIAGNWVDFIVPVRKGYSYTVRMIECESGLYSFFKLVGGAKSLLAQAVSWVRGGVLWLTSSILSARYISCRALKRFRQTAQLITQRRPKVRLSHRAMAISALEPSKATTAPLRMSTFGIIHTLVRQDLQRQSRETLACVSRVTKESTSISLLTERWTCLNLRNLTALRNVNGKEVYYA